MIHAWCSLSIYLWALVNGELDLFHHSPSCFYAKNSSFARPLSLSFQSVAATLVTIFHSISHSELLMYFIHVIQLEMPLDSSPRVIRSCLLLGEREWNAATLARQVSHPDEQPTPMIHSAKGAKLFQTWYFHFHHALIMLNAKLTFQESCWHNHATRAIVEKYRRVERRCEPSRRSADEPRRVKADHWRTHRPVGSLRHDLMMKKI